MYIYICILLADEEMKDELAGTTAVITIIKNNKLYCVSMPKQEGNCY